MNRRAYALAVIERAVKTAAQAALLVLGADQVNAMHASWADVAGFALGGFVLSVLTSLATSGFGNDGPSATTENVGPPAFHIAGEMKAADLRRDESGRSGLYYALLIAAVLAALILFIMLLNRV